MKFSSRAAIAASMTLALLGGCASMAAAPDGDSIGQSLGRLHRHPQ